MHSNPFSAVGYDLSSLKREIEQKAERHEVATLRSNVDRLEHSVREISATINGLRQQLDIIQEDAERVRQANGQFGVGA